MAQLKIGFHGQDSAEPDLLDIWDGEIVDVKVAKDCSVYFAKNDIFDDDPDCRQPQRYWRPRPGHRGEQADYKIMARKSKRPKRLETTHSIRISSVFEKQGERAKAKPKTKAAKAKKTTTKKAKPRK